MKEEISRGPNTIGLVLLAFLHEFPLVCESVDDLADAIHMHEHDHDAAKNNNDESVVFISQKIYVILCFLLMLLRRLVFMVSAQNKQKHIYVRRFIWIIRFCCI